MAVKELLLLTIVPPFPLSLIVSHLARSKLFRLPVLAGIPVLAYYVNSSFEGAPWFFLTPWALLTSIFYIFRSVSCVTLERWFTYVYIALINLIWIFLVQGAYNLTVALCYSLVSIPPVILISFIENTYGTTHFMGISPMHPARRLTLLTVMSSLVMTGFPFSISFLGVVFGFIKLSLLETLLLSILWFLWGWSFHSMISRFIVGEKREDVDFVDLPLNKFLLVKLALLCSFILSAVILKLSLLR